MTWLSLDGTANARDIGGLRTIDGRTTRSGVLLRSDNLQDLTPADIALLTSMGLGTVLDLRTAPELEIIGPGPLRQSDVRHVHLDLVPLGLDGRENLVDRTIPAEGAHEHAMDHNYFDYVRDAPEGIAQALREIADPSSGTVLVHCAAGKDRTGVVIALALSLVGVTRDEVVADYVRTDERVAAVRDRLIATELYSAAMQVRTVDAMRPRAESMERFLDRIDREYGGVHALAASIGVSEETLGALSRRLVGSAH